MKIPFEQLDLWKRACQLSIKVYSVFDNIKDYGLYNQITRAAVSVPSNIAGKLKKISSEEMITLVNEAEEISCMLQAMISNPEKI